MSIKSDVSQNYLAQLRHAHGHKQTMPPANVLLTGDELEGSIGEAIRKKINGHALVVSYQNDVRVPVSIDLSTFDTLIMCHGVTHLEWFEEVDMEKVEEMIEVNLTGSYRIAQAFVKDTIALDYRKRIIMIGSMAHKAVLNGSSAYCASKAGLAHLARCMAWELAPKGYDVFIIHPSNTYGTPMSEETIRGLMRYRGLSRADAESYWNDSPIRDHILTREEIAACIDYILNGPSEYLAGAQIELAGGQR